MRISKEDRVIDPDRIGAGRVEQGIVLNVRDDGTAEVRWDGGTQTIQAVSSLRLTSYPTKYTPGTPGYIGYPKNDLYQWGEFAFAAIELGGYSDMSLVDPFTGSRLWVGDILEDGPSWTEALHRLATAAELAGFFTRAESDPDGLLEEARLGRAPTEQETRQKEMRQRHEEERDALMRRHVEERNEFFRQYESPIPEQAAPAETPEPAA